MIYRVLYRGQLSSCNYDCHYCPFAKRSETHAELADDRRGLQRFVNWIIGQSDSEFRILFTPWGEALIRYWYQDALQTLTNTQNVVRAAIQTNLSSDITWIENCNQSKLGLWATYHPDQTCRSAFVDKVHQIADRGVLMTVGVVGLREHFREIEDLRRDLPVGTYLWINAYKRQIDYYTTAEQAWLASIDPHFPVNNVRHSSFGELCETGETSITIDGMGNIRRCHFVETPIGNIASADWKDCLRPRTCPESSCGCYIGYVNMPKLRLIDTFGDGLLERLPLKTTSATSLT